VSGSVSRNRHGYALQFGLAGMVLLLSGCIAADRPLQRGLESSSARTKDCAHWFASLDKAVDRAGVRDAEAHRISGFPYLRVDRLLASFRNEAMDDPVKFAAWVGHLRTLDATARGYELRNLSPELVLSLGVPSTDAAAARSEACAAELEQADLAAASQREVLVARAEVPDDYIELNRVLGVYPIATIPLAFGVDRWQEQSVDAFRRTAAGDAATDPIARYDPPGTAAGARELAAIFARAQPDRLGIPQFGRDDRERLFQAFAPIFEIDTSGSYDRFGTLAWGADPAPQVDVSDPVSYRRLAFVRYGNRVLVQLIYTIWFPERPRAGSVDLLSGRLDGLVFRVTLDPEGRPLVYDSIHPCGCYHMFFPTPRVKARPSPQPGIEWAFVPATLPSVDPSHRIVLGVASRSHYIVYLGFASRLGFASGGRGARYRFADDDDLRAIPVIGGATRSAFGPDGIVPGTERGERLLLWPAGVENAGAMRQSGRRATAFLGRRHFDDPDLIERRFSLVEPLPGTGR
jgi:hypothetical protein